MSERATCCNCECDCTNHHWLCDEEADGVWCPDCWEKTACCAGVHGEGCPTQVFNAGTPIESAQPETWCPFCKKAHVGGNTCMGHHP